MGAELFKIWPNIFLKGRNTVKLCKVHPFFQKKRSGFFMSMNLWGKTLSHHLWLQVMNISKLTLIFLTTSLQELRNYLFKHNQREWHRESTKYMYKYTVHICTKTSLNVSLTCSWGFLHPSGLPQNTAMIKVFFFYTNYHKLVHNGEHGNINREGNKEVTNREKQISGEIYKQISHCSSFWTTQPTSLEV